MSWELAVVLVAVLGLIPVVLRKPIVAIYVVVGAATTIEIYPLGFPDSFTDKFPFFLNLNNSAGLPVSINPAEVLLAVALIAWITTTASQRALYRPSRKILRAYLVFMGVVVFAEGWGILNGGNWNISLWELRPQVYGFILFLLSASLVRERRHVITLAVVFLACAGLKAGVGYYRYFYTLHQNLTDQEAILGHEDSYFLAMFLVATVVAAIWIRRRKLVLLLLVSSPVVAIVMFENRRRAAELALWGALVVVGALGIRYESAIRKRLVVATAIVAIAFVGFLVTYWNAEWGLSGQIVRPFHAIMGQVDQRDYLSDLYRTNENLDLKYGYSTSPLIGVGFGRPMQVVFPLASISERDPLWQYITHNSILWVAMRMGILGMAAFWALIAMIVLEGVRVLRNQEDPLLRAVVGFALAALMAELLVGYADVQLEAYRNMIFVGAMIGLVDAVPRVRVAVAEREPVPRPLWIAAPAPALPVSSQRLL
jgi:hypothetical protein